MLDSVPAKGSSYRLLTSMLYLSAMVIVLLTGMFVSGVLIAGGPGDASVIAKVNSPDGRVQAVEERIGGGATSGFGYRVWLRSPSQQEFGTRVANLDESNGIAIPNGADLVWTSDRNLEIRFLHARDSKLYQPEAMVNGHPVGVRLIGPGQITAKPGMVPCSRPCPN